MFLSGSNRPIALTVNVFCYYGRPAKKDADIIFLPCGFFLLSIFFLFLASSK